VSAEQILLCLCCDNHLSVTGPVEFLTNQNRVILGLEFCGVGTEVVPKSSRKRDIDHMTMGCKGCQNWRQI
jgi:hypothetical protein